MNTLPQYPQPIADKSGTTNKAWYQFFQSVWNGIPPTSESTVTVTSSPFTYTAPRGGFVIVQGGTVSLVQWRRGTVNHTTGATQGPFPVSSGDALVITYSGTPNVTFVPQ